MFGLELNRLVVAKIADEQKRIIGFMSRPSSASVNVAFCGGTFNIPRFESEDIFGYTAGTEGQQQASLGSV